MARKQHTYDYPRPALTVDLAVVTREGRPRVLLIRRGREPFAGRWALPGGFVDENEPLEAAARRELREEAGVEAGDVVQLATFGDPGRDPRGWNVSVVYLARVEPGAVTPKAGDDAAEADWFPLDDPPELAFDHADILAVARARLAEESA